MDFINLFQEAYSYREYRNLLDALLAAGKTTGSNQTETYLRYATLNMKRMQRLDKRPDLEPEVKEAVKGLKRSMFWLILTEGWCGDAAQIVPVVQRMAEENPHVLPRYILRDEHPDVMDQFLTDGGRAIPIIIMLNPKTGKVINHWGPRPAEAQKIVRRWKASNSNDYEVLSKELHAWYARDRTLSVQREFMKAVQTAAK